MGIHGGQKGKNKRGGDNSLTLLLRESRVWRAGGKKNLSNIGRLEVRIRLGAATKN